MSLTQAIPTVLVIAPLSGAFTPLVLPPYAGRQINQSLDPITSIGGGGGDVMGTLIQRDINGDVMDLTYPQFRKYASVVTCRDQVPPSFNAAWHGLICQVDCIPEWNYLTGGTAERPAVAGSERTDGPVTFYRPSLLMIVAGLAYSQEEYSGLYNWRIVFQEV